MEKFLKVTVNGNVYDVKVEDVKNNEVSVNTEAKPVEAPKVEEKKEAPVKNDVAAGVNDIKITAPMPGNIWKIKTSVGSKVAKHEVLLILEAMKMENEIVATEAGTVTGILVKEGNSVEPGKVLVTIGR